MIDKDTVLKLIQGNPGIKFGDICRQLGVPIGGRDNADRKVDGICQQLRKGKQIVYNKGWHPL